jgi:hypothetical protein
MHAHASPASALILIAAVITLGYAVACAAWPFCACRRCGGAGKLRSPSGRAFRYCRHCKGTGGRLHTGRRAWNYLRRLHHDATRR